MSSYFRFTFFLVAGAMLFACSSAKKTTQESIYFKDISDSILMKTSIEYVPILQKGDILSIIVVTPNESSSKLFNRPNVVESSASSIGSTSTGTGGGYLIDEKGNINIPYLGNVKAAGLTRPQLTDNLTTELRKYIDSANVTVRLLNYRITVLGEVARPGTFAIPSERVTIIDAIGLAGDLTIFGKRNNIRVIRQTENGRQTGTIDINKGDIFDSPFYYLRQNDIVYVEMNDRKVINSDQSSLRTFGIVVALISAIGILVSTINIISN